ncbi:unnamed protein product [Boreogadus saida]
MVRIGVNHRGGLIFTGRVALSQFRRREDGETGSGLATNQECRPPPSPYGRFSGDQSRVSSPSITVRSLQCRPIKSVVPLHHRTVASVATNQECRPPPSPYGRFSGDQSGVSSPSITVRVRFSVDQSRVSSPSITVRSLQCRPIKSVVPSVTVRSLQCRPIKSVVPLHHRTVASVSTNQECRPPPSPYGRFSVDQSRVSSPSITVRSLQCRPIKSVVPLHHRTVASVSTNQECRPPPSPYGRFSVDQSRVLSPSITVRSLQCRPIKSVERAALTPIRSPSVSVITCD